MMEHRRPRRQRASEIIRKQKRKELDARRSKCRIRIGSQLEQWCQLKEQLGFSLHSQLAKYLLDRYSSHASVLKTGSDSSCADPIAFPSEALQCLVVLSHNHSQECGFIPNVKTAVLEQERVCSQLEWECLAGHTFAWSLPASKISPPPFCQTVAGGREEQEEEANTTKLSSPPSPVTRCRRSLRKAAAAHAISLALASSSPCPVDEPEPSSQEDEECVTDRERTMCLSPASLPGLDKETELVCNTNSDEREAAPDEIPDSTEAPGPERILTLLEETPESVSGPPEEEEAEDFTEEDNMIYMDDLRDENYQPSLDSCRKQAQPGDEDMSQIGPKRIRKAAKREILLCDYDGCGKIFSNRQYLNHHKKYQHVHQKTFTCSDPSCGKSFNFKKHLKEHEKLHSDKRDYICEFCARFFRTSSNLIIHRRIHTGEKPLQCEICGFTCRQKASLNWHMKKHDADSFYQFSCDLCGKKFEKKDNVTAHKSRSHPEGATGPPPPTQEPPPLSSPLAEEPMANPVQAQLCDMGEKVEPPALAITVIIE
ncbi:zinc finger protein 692 [Pseudonaja textilis]|uniref:Zinc finger protein 692 n=1 Tax=Pseudonaja textilis TaxID=8673 RepID=A0A670Z357_PSETE|nr:zinc finger protein 692 [Pseudonaja textilis]XP_026573660.1 zinc finger protein 692 [Pseudonaja textilis]XP_026573661.1 zinc finger protein 692 [Pseudonaja textilis]